ncbi:hypothetical protein BISA_1389 [Bifidobacterium saguini DSM 23967]|uniref:Uncharacterized protein n=1 Tax=Bifidobacterium saguini DSM 23967 TaxID=1437607 RepID=A0A087DCH3_9BIFI|nr:hypothetical protein [Bifidobacterium saguini]KFI93223.1 hypothetical protein BISA_1389 [Bifidobacterium saguini DSM 23967]
MTDIIEIERILALADEQVKAHTVAMRDLPAGAWWRRTPFQTVKGDAITSADWSHVFDTLPAWAEPAYELQGFDHRIDSIAAILEQNGIDGLRRLLREEESAEANRFDDMEEEERA